MKLLGSEVRKLRAANSYKMQPESIFKNNAATQRGATRYRDPGTGGAAAITVMSSGDSSDVSIHRCQPAIAVAGAGGTSKSSASQYALNITCNQKGSWPRPKRRVNATLCELSAQSWLPSRTPCQSISERRSSSLTLTAKLSTPPPTIYRSRCLYNVCTNRQRS